MSDMLQVTMLDSFSIRYRGECVDDRNNRVKKVWLLLAYLIYSRNVRATEDSYLNLLWGSADESDDPAGRLKAIFYRARTMLDQLGKDVGHKLIIRKGGTYAWNNSVPLHLDVEEFDQLCKAAASAEDEAKLAHYLNALDIYKGDFLPKLSTEAWVMPIATYYHEMYLTALKEVLPMLEDRRRYEEAIAICNHALKIEPYSEFIHQSLMRCKAATGDRAGALAVYDDMYKVLLDTFGVMPSEDSRKLYREISSEVNNHSVPISTLKEQLREPIIDNNAMFCEYDFFKLLYQAQARSIVRSGETIHIALLSLFGVGRTVLAKRSLNLAVDNLKSVVLKNLRQGDVVSRCSESQLIIMLPQSNYENSCIVCDRIIKAFFRQYPHSPAEIHFNIYPLEPSVAVTGMEHSFVIREENKEQDA